jgi:hypothetical protein
MWLSITPTPSSGTSAALFLVLGPIEGATSSFQEEFWSGIAG